MDSILTSIKKLLGITEEYTEFDTDIILFINSALMSLNQLGIGPDTGFTIKDKTAKWSDLLGTSTDVEAVKPLVYLKTRLIFDPPLSTPVLEALQRQILELEWRLTIQTGGDV